MSARLFRHLPGILLVLVLGAATAGAAVAHRLSSGGPEAEALTAYLAMGGKLADLCGKGDPAAAHCDACRHIGPALPPEAPRGAGARDWPVATVPPPGGARRSAARFRPSRARGPPYPVVRRKSLAIPPDPSGTGENR